MFKQFVSPTQKELFLKAIESPTCTVQSLLQHSQIAEQIAKQSTFESQQHMKETILKRWPHLKQVVDALMPGPRLMSAEAKKPAKPKKKSELPSIPKIIFGTLLAAIAVLAAGAGVERSNYHHEVAQIPSLQVPTTVNYPAPPSGSNPVDHVHRVLDTVDEDSAEGQLWKDAQENSLARTRAQKNHRGGVAGVLAKAFRASSGSKDATIDTLVDKYAARFNGDVKKVVLKIGNPSKTNATADAAAFVFLQILAPIGALAASGWTVKMVSERVSGSDDDEEDTIEEIEDLTKEEALKLAATLKKKYPVVES